MTRKHYRLIASAIVTSIAQTVGTDTRATSAKRSHWPRATSLSG